MQEEFRKAIAEIPAQAVVGISLYATTDGGALLEVWARNAAGEIEAQRLDLDQFLADALRRTVVREIPERPLPTREVLMRRLGDLGGR